MIYVHIGAGAGDLDAGAHFRDGFSEFVKQSDDSEKKIYVVEALSLIHISEPTRPY